MLITTIFPIKLFGLDQKFNEFVRSGSIGIEGANKRLSG
tara:strand:- start:1331 stop:1447 length:117 start_codon:yes stop_codon:yes gene_type:complete